MKDFKTKVLEYYNLTENDYSELVKETTLDDLPNPFKCENIGQCADFIKEKFNSGVKTLIYGDYDCDGIVATSIIYLTLKNDNFTPGFYIPFRETDGYGLTINNIDKFYDLGYRLLILVDNGITLNEEIDYANSNGMEIVVIDHHIKGETLPDAKFILHPIYSNYTDINISAGCLSFIFSWAYLGRIDEYLLSIASISAISDLMELKGFNRTIVKLGLKAINNNRYFNILKLIHDSGEKTITEDDLSLVLVPKINSIGRIVEDNKLFNIVRYLTNYSDTDFIIRTLEWIESVNNYRKVLVSELGSRIDYIDDSKCSICVLEDNVKEGLIGILASRLMNDYNKPCVVLVRQKLNPYIYKGSVRSKSGFDVDQMLVELSDLLETYGGHKNAGGLSLKEQNYDAFKERFEEFAKGHRFVDDRKYIEITTDDISYQNYKFLRTLAPFGHGFKKPLFKLTNYCTDLLNYSKDQKHIITKLGLNSSLVYFNYDRDLLNSRYVDFFGTLEINEFRGYYSIQFAVNEFTKK